MALFVLLNNFLHDFSAAGWVFGGVVLWSVVRQLPPGGRPGDVAVRVLKTVLLLMRISFFGIIVFGVIRTLAYRKYEWNAAAGEGQVVLLIVKHVLFTVIFVVGLVYYLRARKLVRSERTEAE